MANQHWTAHEARQRLYEVIRSDISFEEKARDALELGVEYLGADNGHLTRIDRETNHWEALVSTDPPSGRFPQGLELDLGMTYCRQTIESNSPIALYDASSQGWADDPAFETHRLHCYHGTTLLLENELYGTVCFVSEDPRDEHFSDGETMFAELLTRLLERELEREQHEIQLTRQTNLATVLNRVLRHNLRNDMSVIRGYTELMADKLDDDLYSKTALANIDDLLALSQKARELDRIIAADFERESTNIVSLIEESLESVRNEFPAASVTVEADDEITAAVLPSFRHAVEELLENAVKHSGDRPTIIVTVDHVPNAVEIQIIDDGPGLAENEADVFKSGAETPLIHGSGLGLWLAHWIVTSHDGTADATVTESGTTMTISIPRKPGTDVNQQLAKLTRARDQYQAAFEEAHDAMLIINDDARIVEANPEASSIYGLDSQKLLGHQIARFLPDDFEFESAWQEFQTAGSERDTVTVTDASGEEHHVEYTATTDIVPGLHLIVSRDITEHNERQQESQRERDRFRAVFEEAFDPMLIADDEGCYVDANRQALELFGLSKAELQGRSIAEFAAEDFDFDGAWHEFQQSGEERGTFPLVRADGTERTVEYAAATNIVPGQHLSVLRDVTEREKRNRALQRERDRLDEFATIISHDLRNPLAVAQGRLDIIGEEYDSEQLDTVDRALERIESLIDDLLTLSQHGESVTDIEPVSLASLADDCWRNVETANATLTVDTDRTIVADRSRLQQLMENLFRNAVEHGDEGVTVRVGTLPDERGFYVEDNGPGIPTDSRDRIFEAGFTTTEAGTGYGLNIVQEIVDGHDWALRVTAGREGGARFEITTVERGH